MNNNCEIAEVGNRFRIDTMDIWKQLGYRTHRSLVQLMGNNIDGFERFGDLSAIKNHTKGRPGISYSLNLSQVLLLASLVRNDADGTR